MGEQCKFLHIAALVAYDGTDFFGFQYQANQQSIQGSLEDALSKFCRYSGRVSGSGRTDTGVHAFGQVVGVRVEWKHELDALLRAWNVHLPSSILVRSICNTTEEFHPRFSALSRTYRYYVTSVETPKSFAIRRWPLTDRHSLFVASLLDIDAMNAASRLLIGQHDFAAFGQPTQGESTIRQLTEAYWVRAKNQEFPITAVNQQQFVFTVTGSGFLRHMVRNLVGTLLLIGTHQLEISQLQEILASKQRERCAPPAPPHGLVLESVEYPAELGLSF